MLLDKGYYDYDYHDYGDKVRAQQNAPKNNEELKAMLDSIGIGRKESDAEALQRAAMQALGESPDVNVPRGTININQ